ncbi:MAG: XdhC family protein [Gammaproteobacteria bacterium]|nr:XdhC family protein [Gammaproteobacteria bacterium]
MHTAEQDPIQMARKWRDAGNGVALATVVDTWGSSPRPVGSHLAARADGLFAGSVSGGCIEGEVALMAKAVIGDGLPRQRSFGVSDRQAWKVGLACGGRVHVLVQSLDGARWLDTLDAARTARRAVALVIRLADARLCLWQDGCCEGPLRLDDEVADEVASRVAADRSGPLSGDNGLFLRVYSPLSRLLVVGAVHIAQALIPMADLAGFDVTLIDPRDGYASPERFPHVAMRVDPPEKALAALLPDAGTAVVTLSHEPELDDQALAAALASPAFYVGALGSRRTHALRVERLRKTGIDDASLTRIHAPVGLELGGRQPAEIAVAILAQILQTRYRTPR